jgi:hypothetical protein
MSSPVDRAVVAAGEVIDDGLQGAIDVEAGLGLVYADARRRERPGRAAVVDLYRGSGLGRVSIFGEFANARRARRAVGFAAPQLPNRPLRRRPRRDGSGWDDLQPGSAAAGSGRWSGEATVEASAGCRGLAARRTGIGAGLQPRRRRLREAQGGTKDRSAERGVSWRLILCVASVLVLAVVLAGSALTRRGVTVAGRPNYAGPIGASPLQPNPPTTAVGAPPTAAEASLLLQSLLGRYTVLAADMMRSRLHGDPGRAQAASAALGKNADALSGLIGSLVGAQAKTRFAVYWAAHATALFNYARALTDHDNAVRAAAKTTIAKFESDLAGFLASASQGRLPRHAAEVDVRTHIEYLEGQAAAYAAGNYTQADQINRQGYTHAFGWGKVLANALLPAAAAAALSTPAWRLRSELDRLLGEHDVAVVAAMRAGVTNSPEFTAAAQTVNGNTRDLAAAIDTLLGAAPAARFEPLWANRVDALIGYSAAVVTNDDTARAGARAKMTATDRQVAALLAAATKNRIAAAALAKTLGGHDDMLLREADAFARKDYRQAYDLASTSYQDLFTLAGQLASAFSATIASQLPVGAVQTGRGGMAAVVQLRRHAGKAAGAERGPVVASCTIRSERGVSGSACKATRAVP